MSAIHTEKAFEDAIEYALLSSGYLKRTTSHFDPELAIDQDVLLEFIQDTQRDTWDQLEKHLGAKTGAAIVEAVVKALDAPKAGGTLDVLRHGVRFYGKKLRLAYFRPASGLNPDVVALYGKNRPTITRQVRFIPGQKDSIDMLVSLNGLPVATLELKNPLTGQNVNHAKKQYRERDPKHPLLRFKHRALVHFAVDPDLVYMTTKLAGDSTYFLPFNRGCDGGAGNPEHPSGHRTAYLWEEVLHPDSLLDILARFVHLERTEQRRADGSKVKKEKLIFPRYHQLDVVRRIEHAVREEGVGRNYLVQHSAGSGKSNSIAWLAHRLASLHDADDNKIFNSVVVVTDRRVLDKQLQDTIYQFEHKQGVVEPIDKDSGQLTKALEKGTPIIITTLQKFPFVTARIENLPARNYAVIIDEAHSSQSGEAAAEMRRVLGTEHNANADEFESVEDAILETVKARGRQPNLSMFAFTATPKHKTLKIFEHEEGAARPYHLYTMRQAIEEGFILDVLRNYTTYKTYYRLVKEIADDPELDKRKAARALARFVSLHPHNIAQKTEVIVEHFRHHTRHRIGGRAKAMVVTRSRLHAVRYKQQFDKYIRDKGYEDVQALVAFSGTVEDELGASYTTLGLNPGLSSGTPEAVKEAFATDDYNVLLVAEMFQTGFDQPLLHTMYVDKRLGDIQAVQTLSRLNRTHPGKADTFVLDFVNEADEVREAFAPFYEQTVIAEEADPQQLYHLMTALDGRQVYLLSEVDAFCKVFFKPAKKQKKTDHAELDQHVIPAVSRFKALDEEEREEFRSELNSFLRLYAYLAQVMPYADVELEKRYAFGRLLATRLPRDEAGPKVEFHDEVRLVKLLQKKTFEGDIVLPAGQHHPVRGPKAVGTKQAHPEPVRLSTLVELLNERFGTDFTEAEQLFGEQVVVDVTLDEKVQQQARANTFENYKLAIKKEGVNRLLDRMEANKEFSAKLFGNPEMLDVFTDWVAKESFRRINEGEQPEDVAAVEAEQASAPEPEPDAGSSEPSPSAEKPEPEVSLSDEADDELWDETLDVIAPEWMPLAVGLRAAGLPPPEHVHIDLKLQERTTETQAILLWQAEAGFLALVEDTEGLDQSTGELVQVAPDSEVDEIVKPIEAWLAQYR